MILDGRKLEAVDLQRICNVITAGGIIAFPTDTVYGIGCDAFNSDAIARIYALKKRKRAKPLVLFVPDKNLVNKYANPKPEAKRLIEKFFPGPLTVIVNSSNSSPSELVDPNGRIGVRIPKNDVILKILNTLPTPLATTSANPSGKEETTTANSVASQFMDEELEIIIDGGLCNRPPSAVIDTTTFPPILLRKGHISIPEIERTLGCEVKLGEGVSLIILFVCTGNSCRSPMASGLLRKQISTRARKRVRIISAGSQATSGSPPTQLACRVAKKNGFDITLYRSRPLTRDILEKADLVIGFEAQHLDKISELLPDASSRSFLLKAFKRNLPPNQAVITDPVGGGLEAYESCMAEIKDSMGRIVRYLEDKFI